MRHPGKSAYSDQENESFSRGYMELSGSSTRSVEDAVAKAMRRAYQTKKPLSGFQLVETRSIPDNGNGQAWRVTLKVGCSITSEPCV